MKLTLRSLAQRALWEVDGRSGFKALRTPRGQVPIPKSVPDFEGWWRELPATHRLRALPQADGEAVPEMTVDWHLDPLHGARWPSDEHWTHAIHAGVGDLRSTWEINRFGHVWDWIAAGQNGAAEFERQLLDWRWANPFRGGVNWASGQELAVRSVAWLAGAAVWGRSMTPAGWRSLVELLYWHGVQIEAEFAFAANTVRNNHVLAEGLGLAAIADAFPGFPESRRWRERGIAAVVEGVDEQFFEDGGYCQHSHAYHSFALELLFEASDWFEDVRTVTRPVFERSLRYFSAIVEPGGRAPNYGPNDRARPVDYDVLLTELCRRTDGARAERGSASFPHAGLHVLRADGVGATMRCGPLALRAGHADGLNVEVWLGGEPVAVDAGSYCYGCVEHDDYVRGASHNVVLVDHDGPRRLASRFTWAAGPDPVLVEFDARRRLTTATYAAYPGLHWERQLRVDDDGADIIDHLNSTREGRPRLFTLQWLLDADADDVHIEAAESFTWNISSPRSRITISAKALIGELSDAKGAVWPVSISRVYGEQELVSRIEVAVSGQAVRFRTSFERR